MGEIEDQNSQTFDAWSSRQHGNGGDHARSGEGGSNRHSAAPSIPAAPAPSRGETSGYSGSSPTVGRIFQERAHLVPLAFFHHDRDAGNAIETKCLRRCVFFPRTS